MELPAIVLCIDGGEGTGLQPQGGLRKGEYYLQQTGEEKGNWKTIEGKPRINGQGINTGWMHRRFEIKETISDPL